MKELKSKSWHWCKECKFRFKADYMVQASFVKYHSRSHWFCFACWAGLKLDSGQPYGKSKHNMKATIQSSNFIPKLGLNSKRSGQLISKKWFYNNTRFNGSTY